MNERWPDFNDLWDYRDPAATERLFRERLSSEAATEPSYRLQLLTQIGRALGLQGKFDAAHAILDQVAQQMEGEDVIEVRYLLERGRLFNSAGEPEKGIPLFRRAYGVGRAIAADYYAVDALHMLGIVLPFHEGVIVSELAIDYAKNSPQERAQHWLGSLANNLGWALFDNGRHEEALGRFEEALHYRQQEGKPKEIAIARWCIAKTLRVLGRVEEALAILRDLDGQTESDGFTKEELGECLYTLGRVEQAKPYFAQAYELLSHIGWVAADQARIQRLRELSTP